MTKGFSKLFILFLLIVIALIAFVAFTPGLVNSREYNNVFSCFLSTRELLSALNEYNSINGSYPDSLDKLSPKYVKNKFPEDFKDDEYYKMQFRRAAFKGEGSPSNPPFIYIKPAPDASPDTIVLIDNNHKSHKIIGYKSGNAKMIPRSFWERTGIIPIKI